MRRILTGQDGCTHSKCDQGDLGNSGVPSNPEYNRVVHQRKTSQTKINEARDSFALEKHIRNPRETNQRARGVLRCWVSSLGNDRFGWSKDQIDYYIQF